MENKARILTICGSYEEYPQLVIRGLWFGHFGFRPGEQITITNPKTGVLQMEVTMPAKPWYAIKHLKRLKSQVKRLKKSLACAGWESECLSIQSKLKAVEQELEQLQRA